MLNHHSSADFDYIYPTWILDPAHFISPPSSLRFHKVSPYAAQGALLHHSKSGVMEEGRIVSWFRTEWLGPTRRNLFIFRNTSPDGTPSIVGSYALHFSQDYLDWVFYTAPDTYIIINHYIISELPYFILAGQWYLLRISWWNGMNPQNQLATVLRVEKYIADWTQYGVDWYDTNQRNKGQSIQRAGVGIYPISPTIYNWWDDTQFWK